MHRVAALCLSAALLLAAAHAADPKFTTCGEAAVAGAKALIRPRLIDAFRTVEPEPNTDSDPKAMDWTLDAEPEPGTPNCDTCEFWRLNGQVFNTVYETQFEYDTANGVCFLVRQAIFDSAFLDKLPK